MEILANYQLYAKMSKCVFAAKEMEYLGHVISEEGVKTDPKKIKAMKDWPVPKSLKALRGFLGLTGYYKVHQGIWADFFSTYCFAQE